MAARPLPFEFVVVGLPLSPQSQRRDHQEQWQAHIRHAALKRWPSSTPPVSIPVELSIIYYYDYHDRVMLFDDVLTHLIQDALAGLVYRQSDCVSDLIRRGRNMSNGFQLHSVTPALAEGLCSAQAFLQIKVAPAPRFELSQRVFQESSSP